MTSHKSGNQSVRKKVQVSFVIRDEVERQHRAGVNSLQYDPLTQKLYSAGRDSIIRTWNTKPNREPYVQSMEHHTDWVNDIILCCDGRTLISASSDTTVKVWNAYKGFCMSTLRTHKDYVRALAYAKDIEQVASAGLDRAIFLWDVNTLTALTATSSISGSKSSIYSLAMNPPATVIISGSTEKVLRVWDPRTCAKQMKLIGHTDNVKALVVNKEGTLCVSGSSDGTVKYWSLGNQHCIHTIRIHTEGVWALLATENFSQVISAGRDKKIYITDLKTLESTLLCEESAPVLKMTATADHSGIWPIRKRESVVHDSDGMIPLCSKPEQTIKGSPALKKYHILNDKRHILTLDTEENVSVFDVLKAIKVEDLGQVDFDEEIKYRYKMIYVPNWFNVDLKTGMLTIHLGQDETDCFAAWVSARDAGLIGPDGADHKVNYGSILLNALLEKWWTAKLAEEDDKKKDDLKDCLTGKEFFDVPPHTPIIFSEVGGRTLYRLLVQVAGGDSEMNLLQETIPEWVENIFVNKKEDVPKFNKIPFHLIPYSNNNNNNINNAKNKKDKVSANDFIQMQKVAEHVYKSILNSDSSVVSAGSPADRCDEPDNASLAEDKVPLDPNMDLRTVRHFIWKSSNDLVLHYKPKGNSRP